MFLGPEELDFLVLFSHPPLNRVLPMGDSQMKLSFLACCTQALWL